MSGFIEVLVLNSNPSNILDWSRGKQLERSQCVMKWHDYIQSFSSDNLRQVWGSHQILSQTRLSDVLDLRAYVVRFENLTEFDKFMNNDPLRSCSKYTTILLTPLSDDFEDDEKRLELAKKGLSIREDNSAAALIQDQQRALFKKAPQYVGKYEWKDCANPIIEYGDFSKNDSIPERPLQLLIVGQNPPEYMAWDDHRKLIHYEKVIWWHHHILQMLEEDKVSHVWGTHDFCDIGELSYRSAAGATVYRARDLSEFDEIYRLDPLRDNGRFWSIALKPIEEQLESDSTLLSNLAI